MQKLRLAKVLQEHRRRLGSYSKLREEINVASGGKGSPSRQKLKALADESLVDVSLKLSELRALDIYLGPFGDGLSAVPLFKQPSILGALGAGTEVVFLLGSKPREAEHRIDLSRWDIWSMARLLRDITSCAGNIHFEVEDALYQKQPHGAQSEEWERWLTHNGVSLVTIGSPRASRASEVILAKMFNVVPFTPPGFEIPPLPFAFVWRPDKCMAPSHFAVDAADIAKQDESLSKAILRKGSYTEALRVGDRFYESRQSGRRWTSYGVIAAQQRRNDQFWLAVCGLTGPATYAAAKVVQDELLDNMPHRLPGQHSPVMWAIVEARIKPTKTPGDNRHLLSSNIIEGPHTWQPMR